MDSIFTIEVAPCGVRAAELLGEPEVLPRWLRWRSCLADEERSGEAAFDLRHHGRGHVPDAREVLSAIEVFAGNFAREHRLEEMLIEANLLGPFPMYLDEEAELRVRRPPPLRFED